MNKIVLNKPLLLNKKYVVFFDSDNKFVFRNKREATDFIVKVGKEIEESVLFITEEFNHLEEFYRLYYLADKDYKFKFTLGNSIDFLNNRLAWMLSREGSPNHDAIVFQAIISCIEELKTAFLLMQEKAAQRKDTITKRRCALKVHVIEIYIERFLAIGIKPKESFLRLKKASKN
jgi:hypothetical protein